MERYRSPRHASFDEADLPPEPGDGDGNLFGGGDDGSEIEDPLKDAPSGMPTPENLSTDEMKEYVLKWLKADPSRKQEVMAMVPSLLKEMS